MISLLQRLLLQLGFNQLYRLFFPHQQFILIQYTDGLGFNDHRRIRFLLNDSDTDYMIAIDECEVVALVLVGKARGFRKCLQNEISRYCVI